MNHFEQPTFVQLQILQEAPASAAASRQITLLYLLEGRMEIRSSTQISSLSEQDIYVINAGEVCTLTQAEDEHFLCIRLLLAPQDFRSILRCGSLHFSCDSSKQTPDDSIYYDELRKTLHSLLDIFVSTGRCEGFRWLALCCRLMDQLSVHFLLTQPTEAADTQPVKHADHYKERLRKINDYIEENYTQPISLSELSGQLYLSNGYLSRFFKKTYDMTFSDYLTDIRLNHALEELQETDLSITRIALDNGFTHVSLFNKAFKKKWGKTPTVWRRHHQEELRAAQQDVPPSDDQIRGELAQFLQKDISHGLRPGIAKESVRPTASKTISTRIPVRPCYELRQIWNDTLNIGSASDLLRSEIQDHCIILKRGLGIRYVRFWNLFSDDMLLTPQTDAPLNFTRLDLLLDFLLHNQLRPHIELGTKPQDIYGSVKYTVHTDTKNLFFCPDPDRFSIFMEKLMQHLCSRYSLEQMSTWRMELWWDHRVRKQPDALRSYCRLFQKTYRVIKSWCPGLSVGGYEISLMHDDESPFVKKFLTVCTPDFLSLILYAYKVVGMEEHKSPEENCLSDQLDQIHHLLSKLDRREIPVCVTEWNLTYSARNHINDSCFKGAYIIRNYIDFYGKTPYAAYFCGTDRTSEYSDSDHPLFGGAGLLSKDSIFKPAGFAVQFLQRLYPYFIAKSEHYIITTDAHNCYSIVCQNACSLNYQYYLTPEHALDRENIEKYYDHPSVLHLHLTLTGLRSGCYRQKIFRVNEKTGELLGTLKQLHFPSYLDQEDIFYLRSASDPQLSFEQYEVTTDQLTLTLDMEPNEILYLRLVRI